jgi:hypothetical protein
MDCTRCFTRCRPTSRARKWPATSDLTRDSKKQRPSRCLAQLVPLHDISVFPQQLAQLQQRVIHQRTECSSSTPSSILASSKPPLPTLTPSPRRPKNTYTRGRKRSVTPTRTPFSSRYDDRAAVVSSLTLTVFAVPAASLAYLIVILIDGEPLPSAEATSPTAVRRPSHSLPSHFHPLFLPPAPVLPASMHPDAVPPHPLPKTSKGPFRYFTIPTSRNLPRPSEDALWYSLISFRSPLDGLILFSVL